MCYRAGHPSRERGRDLPPVRGDHAEMFPESATRRVVKIVSDPIPDRRRGLHAGERPEPLRFGGDVMVHLDWSFPETTVETLDEVRFISITRPAMSSLLCAE